MTTQTQAQKTGTVLVYRIDPTYGGSDYVEFYPEGGIYTTGNTRSHAGHGRYDMEIQVATKKELANVERVISELYNFQEVPSLYGYGGNGGKAYDPAVANNADRNFTVVIMYRSQTGPDTFVEIAVGKREFYTATTGRPKSPSIVPINVATKKALKAVTERLGYMYTRSDAEFKPGQTVFHRNLGVGRFVSYDLHDGEAIVAFKDTDGYIDELRISTALLSATK